ncbi:MAG: MobB family relaxase [Bacteroidota bacterium]
MYVGFGKFNGKNTVDNKGSSGAAMSYLSKENEGKSPRDHEHFFNHDNERITETEAQLHIDGYNRHIGKKDAKFYMFTINPSEGEQRHLMHLAQYESRKGEKTNNYSELLPGEKARYQALLKNYTKNVMELYAANFKKGIKGKDLVYVAKVEHERRYKSFHKEVKNNEAITKQIHGLVVDRIRAENSGDNKALQKVNKKIEKLKEKYETHDGGPANEDKSNVIKRGDQKLGPQSHVHIIVHRNTKDYVKISPNAQSRGHQQTGANGQKIKVGFDHEQFKEASGKLFREQFNYRGSEKEVYKKPINERVMGRIERMERGSAKFVANKVKSKVKSEVYSKVFHGEALKMKSQAQQMYSLVQTLSNIHRPEKIIAKALNQSASSIKTSVKAR